MYTFFLSNYEFKFLTRSANFYHKVLLTCIQRIVSFQVQVNICSKDLLSIKSIFRLSYKEVGNMDGGESYIEECHP